MPKLLIVEDDIYLNEGLSYALTNEGYDIISVKNAKEAFSVLNNKIDLAILDINLPDLSGYDLGKRISVFHHIPILFLTAKDEEKDILKGFELGCEDYITKPFSLPILIEKLKVILRRERKNNNTYISKNLLFNFDKLLFMKNEKNLNLTATEIKLIEYFINNRGQVLTKRKLLENVWDIESDFVDENTLSVNISRLRAKIEDIPSKPVWIKTIFGIGYKWSDEI